MREFTSRMLLSLGKTNLLDDLFHSNEKKYVEADALCTCCVGHFQILVSMIERI